VFVYPRNSHQYQDGRAEQLHKRILDYLIPAAENGDPEAQWNLSAYYTEAWHGFPKDLKKSEGLSKYYVHGGHVPKDNFHALQLLKQAAQAGNDDAQKELGEAYLAGEITPRNYVEAAKWLQLAAEQGNGLAMRSLGRLFKDGNGVAKNLVEADKWFILAKGQTCVFVFLCGPDNRKEKQDRDEVEREMTQTQISQAQALASSWKPTMAGVLRDTFFSVKSRRSCSLATDP
jgi:TPR repeat protein